MEPFVPKEVDAEVNTKRIDSTTDILILFAGSLIALILIFSIFVFIIQTATSRISPRHEEKYLSWLASDMVGRPVRDPALLEIFNKLAREQKLYSVQFSIACESNLNAFALPGGRIVIQRGLLEKMKTEEGLAFVVGHELGHLVHRDHLKGLGLAVVSIFASMIFTSDSNWLWNTLHSFLSSAHSRDAEEDADVYALLLMEKIYGSTRGAEEFFLLAKERFAEKIHKKLWFVSSHPMTESRIRKIKARPSYLSSKENKETTLFADVARKMCH